MAPVKLKYIVSFTSQDDCHKANNLLTGDGVKKWLCQPKDRSGKLEMVIQLEEATKFSFIDIGTMWCASLEICVGNSDWPQTSQYKTLVPIVTLMSPIDCQLGRKTTNTQMFTLKDFSRDVIDHKWDRIQIICRQPYRKDMQFGISFIKIRNSDHVSTNIRNVMKDQDPELNKSPQRKNLMDIKRHFFKDSDENKGLDEDHLKQRLLQISSSSESGNTNLHQASLPRTAQLVLKASEKTNSNKANAHYVNVHNQQKRGLFSDTNTSKTRQTLDEEIAAFLPTLNLSMVDFDTVTVADLRHKFERKKRRKLSPQERRKFSEHCQGFIWTLSENNAPDNRNLSVSKNETLSPDHASNHISGRTNSSKKISVNTKSSENQSPPMLSHAAILRKENQSLEIPGNGLNTTCDKEIIFSSDSNNSEESDIQYRSSASDSDSSSSQHTDEDSSPNRKTQLKHNIQTVDDVNRSYHNLYNVSSGDHTNDNIDKSKSVISKSKKNVKVMDTKTCEDGVDKCVTDSPSAKIWLSAQKKTLPTPKGTKKKRCNEVIFDESYSTNEDAAQHTGKRNLKRGANFLSNKFQRPSKSADCRKKNISDEDIIMGHQSGVHVSSTIVSSISSILCKACGFLIPQDTYDAHCAMCNKPAEAMSNQTNHSLPRSLQKSGRSKRKANSSNKGGMSDDLIDLTQSDFPQCPICYQQFPKEILITHASECGLAF